MEVADKAFIKGAFTTAAVLACGLTGSTALTSGVVRGIRAACDETSKEHNPFQPPPSKQGNGENLDHAA